MPTLHRVIDGDAFDTLLTGQTDSTLLISFAYDDAIVSVDGSGSIEVALTEPQH
ncbi:MAG: HalOD1 output domain-containing protein [Haloferacaceae archaeon]